MTMKIVRVALYFYALAVICAAFYLLAWSISELAMWAT